MARRRAPHPIEEIEAFALTFPEAWVDTPWETRVAKVRTKIFVFLGPPGDDDPVIAVKVPESHEHALSYPGAYPTRYGLGRAGWVSIPLAGVPAEEFEVLLDFVEESYRTVAPKRLVAELDERNPDS